ncbi:MAG: TIGR03936 family radical SAM-associated protein [Anaerolineales bacterium]|nr:TIGR03936 family radical SAM-associated protein [Anaerolineales bacterium]
MQANYVQRLRLTFRKVGPTRFIGHLDLARTLERSLNRAGIPIAYSQGFNRRPRMALAVALPLGYTSDSELADIWLAEAMQPAQAQAQLMSRIAPGLEIVAVQEIPIKEPSLETLTVSAAYVISFLDSQDVEDLQSKIDTILDSETIICERKQGRKGKIKQYNLRPLILDLALDKTDAGQTHLLAELALMPAKTGRPDEVLRLLNIDPLSAHVHRTKITLNDTVSSA